MSKKNLVGAMLLLGMALAPLSPDFLLVNKYTPLKIPKTLKIVPSKSVQASSSTSFSLALPLFFFNLSG